MIRIELLNLETFNNHYSERENLHMSGKYGKEIIRLIIYTIIMVLLDIICGKQKGNGDSFDS